jgi:hypothetical protein
MSMQEFVSQLERTDGHDALMGTLHRLSLVEDPRAMIDAAAEAQGDWGIWDPSGGPPQ